MTELVPIRYGRMLASPFAFLCGAAGIMAADLNKTPNTGIKVQACGDCHLSNFGGYGTPERNLVFDVNDFDETLPAPWEWDVKRLAASIVVAGRSLKFSDKASRTAAQAAVQSYREHLNEYAQMTALDVWYAHIGVESLLTFTSRAKELKKIKVEVSKARALTPQLELHNDPLFLQIKEARTSVLEPYAGRSAYENQAQRVVSGQHLMQASTDIFLGWTKGDSGHDFYLRQLRDMKTSVEIEDMSETDLHGYSHLCGWALARSHARLPPVRDARTGNRFMISGYLGQNDTFDRSIANFAVAYADQNDRDYHQLLVAVESGKIKAIEA